MSTPDMDGRVSAQATGRKSGDLASYIRILAYLAVASFVVLSLTYQFASPVQIDIGSGQDTAFIQGFSFRENSPTGTFRWSGANSEIRLWGIGNQSGTLKMRLAAPRPAGQARVQIGANGTSLGEIQPAADLRDFVFPIDRATIGARGDLVVTLASDTFTQAPDTRTLGVQTEQVRFESGGPPVLPAPRALYLVGLTLLAFIAARVWTGRTNAAKAIAGIAILGEAVGLWAARVETVWFSAPLFWFGAAALAGALALAWAMQRLTSALHGTQLSATTFRLVFAVMAAAFAVRMVFATGPGFITDVQDYVVWSYKTVTYGLGTAYTAINGLWIADQSPGLVYLLHVMGLVYRAVFSPDFLYPGVAGDPAVRAANALTNNPALFADPAQRTLLRIPSLLADLITGALIFATVRTIPSPPAPAPQRGAGEKEARIVGGKAPHYPETSHPLPAIRGEGVGGGEALMLHAPSQNSGAWLVALAFWFNPVVLWNGAYWGQTDAVHTLLVLVAFLLLAAHRIGGSFFFLGVAVLTKPQAAVFAPLLLLWVWKTPLPDPRNKGLEWRKLLPFAVPRPLPPHPKVEDPAFLAGRGGDKRTLESGGGSATPTLQTSISPLPAGGEGPGVRGSWSLLKLSAAETGGRMGKVMRALIVGAFGAGLMLVPMLLVGGGSGMLAYFMDTIGHHPILSANAHNLWWFLRNGSIDLPDTSELVPGIPFTYRQASLILFGVFYLAILLKAWRSARVDYFVLGAFAAFAFFMLPTEIHENYGYALLPLLAIAMSRDKAWVAFYIAVSATMVLNYATSDPPLFSLLGIADPATQLALPRELNALANTAIFAVWALYLFAKRVAAIRPEPSLATQGITQ